jgi:5-methylcytosine-specific restriction endonuclease McrA
MFSGPARVTTLPGGARISLSGYLPDRACLKCGISRPAAEFIREIKVPDGRRWAAFGQPCHRCERPPDFPSDLRGLRFTDSYDVDGKLVGWAQRDRAGKWNELSLRLLRVRLDKKGRWPVLRPQPKINRASRERVYVNAPPIVDPARNYPKAKREKFARAQGGVCCYCGNPFTRDNPAHGEHKLAHSQGGRTDDANGSAACRSCNLRKGSKTVKEFRAYLKLNPPPPRLPLFER